MTRSAAVSGVKVSADGDGLASHAGAGLLREVAELTGLPARVTAVLADTLRLPWSVARRLRSSRRTWPHCH